MSQFFKLFNVVVFQYVLQLNICGGVVQAQGSLLQTGIRSMLVAADGDVVKPGTRYQKQKYSLVQFFSAILLDMSLRRLSFPVLVVLAYSVCRSSPVACSAVDEETLFSTLHTGCQESQGCASPLHAPRVWDIPMPSLHEKLYGAHHDEQLPPVAHNGSSAPLSFAYITASSWPRWGSDTS